MTQRFNHRLPYKQAVAIRKHFDDSYTAFMAMWQQANPEDDLEATQREVSTRRSQLIEYETGWTEAELDAENQEGA